MDLRKNDLVEIISGEERGKRGKVLRIQVDSKTKQVRVIVEGRNLSKKHQKARGAGKPGGIVDLPNAIDASNVALLCPKCGKRSKVRRDPHEGKRVRVCKACEEIIDT
jgi:large subunit ribosomal protein L24